MTTEQEGHNSVELAATAPTTPLERVLSLQEEIAEVEMGIQQELAARVQRIDEVISASGFIIPEPEKPSTTYNKPPTHHYRSTDEMGQPIQIAVNYDAQQYPPGTNADVSLTFTVFDDPLSTHENPVIPSDKNRRLTFSVGYAKNPATQQFDPSRVFGMTAQTPDGSSAYRSAGVRIHADNTRVPTPFAAMDSVVGYFQRSTYLGQPATRPTV